MNLAFTVLEITAPVFLLAAIGFGWVKAGFDYQVRFVTQLAMSLSVPCLIFTSLMRTEIDPQALTKLSLAAVTAYAAVSVLAFLLVRIGRLDLRTYMAPIIFGNTGNLGLPLAMFAFGQAGLGYAVVVFAIMAIWSFTFGVWLVAGGGSLTKVVKEPLVGATVLGGIFLWQGWQTPVFLTNALDLIGQMAIPLMLITLGVAVARMHPGHIRRATWISLVKLVLCFGITWVVGRWFQLDKIAFAVLVIQISTPVAVTSYLLAEKYGADSESVAGLVVVSTLMSVIAIPLMLGILL
ncbi:AEC family transporter [Thalassovita aquimarina]|uniref:AEC family transporter n=1 Tax=Thalassovita aquimarina TaxID=2785917 RepID=A0ABS5HNR5_9RHOB|nr:AEC family transporter [Thalassovita aquimarina]